jgi:hypothetical protein
LRRKRLLAALAAVAVTAVLAWPAQEVIARLVNTQNVGGNTLATGAWTNVQTGVWTSTANGTFTVPLSTVDPAKSFLVFNVRSNSNRPVGSVVRGRLLNSTTLEFTRVTDSVAPEPATITVRWNVVTFASGVNVQRGEASISAASPTNIAITPVASTSQAFVLWSKTPAAADNTWDTNDTIVADLTSTSNLQLRYNTTGTHTVSWEVVELTNPAAINVQRGTTSMLGTALTRTVTLPTPVDTTKTFVLVGYQTSGAGADVGSRMLRARLTDSSTIVIDRSISGTPDDITEISWQAIELKNPSGAADGPVVQNGSANLASGTSQVVVPISQVVPERTVAFASNQGGAAQSMGRTPYAGDDIIGVGTATLAVGSTSLTFDRANTASAADIGWFAVQFPAAQP